MHDSSPLRIGTRRSALALAQAETVRNLLATRYPAMTFELVPMHTTGDLRTDRALADIGGKGLFTKELEEAMAEGRIDMAVHSLKDMETQEKDGLKLAATLPRGDARDAFISRSGKGLAALPQGATVGTSSLRRAALLRMHRPDLTIIPFRGNVQTRLDKLARGEADATLLAVAGLVRLGREEVISERLDVETFIPAVGQAAIAVECRAGDAEVQALLVALNHLPTWHASMAERSLLARLDGSCRTPIGAYAVVGGEALRMHAFVARPDGSQHVKAELAGAASDAAALGRELADILLARGGRACLA